jgi:hypothetical protein
MSSSLPVAADTLETERGSIPSTFWFAIHARPEPGVMPRVLELFAKRGLVPHKWHSTASDTALTMDVQIGGLGRQVADYIASCMRQIPGVETVLTVETHPYG